MNLLKSAFKQLSDYIIPDTGTWSYSDNNVMKAYEKETSKEIDDGITSRIQNGNSTLLKIPLTKGTYFSPSNTIYICQIQLNKNRTKIINAFQINTSTNYKRMIKRNPSFDFNSISYSSHNSLSKNKQNKQNNQNNKKQNDQTFDDYYKQVFGKDINDINDNNDNNDRSNYDDDLQDIPNDNYSQQQHVDDIQDIPKQQYDDNNDNNDNYDNYGNINDMNDDDIKDDIDNEFQSELDDNTSKQFYDAYFSEKINDIDDSISDSDSDSDNDNDNDNDGWDVNLNEGIATISSSQETEYFNNKMNEYNNNIKQTCFEHQNLENKIKLNPSNKIFIRKELNTMMNVRKNCIQNAYNQQMNSLKKHNKKMDILWENTQKMRLKHYNNDIQIKKQIDNQRVIRMNYHLNELKYLNQKCLNEQNQIDILYNENEKELLSTNNTIKWHKLFKKNEINNHKINVLEEMIKNKIELTKTKIIYAKYLQNSPFAANLKEEAIKTDREITKIAKLAGETLVIDMVDRDPKENNNNNNNNSSSDDDKYLGFELRFDQNYSTFNSTKKFQIKLDLAKLIGINSDKLQFVSSRAGSIISMFEAKMKSVKIAMIKDKNCNFKNDIKDISNNLYSNNSKWINDVDGAVSFLKRKLKNKVNKKAFYLAQKCVAIVVSHHSKKSKSNILDNEFLKDNNVAQEFHKAIMNPIWDREYGPGKTLWDGILNDGKDRGPYPYFCPSGWKRYAFRIDNFDKRFKGWSVCYHGSENMAIGGILSHGIVGNCRETYFSPSIEYSAHPRYSTPRKMKNGKFVQMIFQCRINPNSMTAVKATFGLGDDDKPVIDPNFLNKNLKDEYKRNRITEFILPGNGTINGKVQYHLTGIMIRISDDPSKLKSSHWWPYVPQRWQNWHNWKNQ